MSSAAGDAEREAVASAQSRFQRMQEWVASLWGPSPPYRPTREDEATLLESFHYGWIGDFITKASQGSITEEDLPRPTLENRTYQSGSRLSRCVHDDIEASRRWHPYVGCEVKFAGEMETRGKLRWIGYIQQSNHPRALVAGVEWKTAPRHRRCDGGVLHHGIVHGERLFEQKRAGAARCSCEPVDEIEVLPRLGGCPPPPPISPSLLRALFKAHPWHVWLQLPPKLLSDLCSVLVPVLLESFVLYLSSEESSWSRGLWLVFGVFTLSATQSIMAHKYDHISIRAAALFSTSSLAMLFEKCLTMSRTSLIRPELSAGRIMNLVANDLDNIGSLNWYVVYFVSAPFQLLICIGLLWRMVGWCAIAAIGVLLVTFPIQGVLSRWQQDVEEKMYAVVDTRIKRTNEFLSGIRIVKFMSWEPRFLAVIERTRETELDYLRTIQYTQVAFMCVDGATPILVISFVFVLYYLGGHDLTPQVVFPTIALLNIMRIPFFMMPVIVSAIIQCMVSVRRVSAFLECEDFSSDVRDIEEVFDGGVGAALDQTNIRTYMPVKLPKYKSRTQGAVGRTLLWFRKWSSPENDWEEVPEEAVRPETPVTADSPKPSTEDADEDRLHQLVPKELLHDITLLIPAGKLTIIIGDTGSGKSTLLGALLGEYGLAKGEAYVHQSIAYVPQLPWIMNATLRQNILFFDTEASNTLDDVVKVCQLTADLKQLSGGLETEIGEKGINLSGGQKARVSLARAVYADRELYLLDDPMSALDAHVGRLIFHDVILGRLASKTRVLATHQTHLLPHADHVVVMSKGRVIFSGSYEAYAAAKASHQELELHDAQSPQDEEQSDAAAEHTEEASSGKSTTEAEAAAGDDEATTGEAGLMTTEEKAVGSVPWTTYRAYIHACGGLSRWMLLLGVFAFTEVINMANGVWLSIWAQRSFDLASSTYLGAYLFVVFCGMFSAPLRSFLCYQSMRIGSRNLHASLLESIGVATLSFFDTTPLGRMLNRFTKDVSILDHTLNDSYMYLLNYVFSMISTIILMSVAQPVVIVALIPCAAIYYRLMIIYNASNRETRRIKSIVHSPVFSLMEGTLQGQRTIAVYNKAHVMLQEAVRRLDTVYSALYMQNIANRWLGVRLELISCVLISLVALAGVVSKQLNYGQGSVGLISLSFTISLTLTETLNWLVRQVAAVEANMNCVERILHYTNDIDHEEMPELQGLVSQLRNTLDIGSDGVVIEASSPTQASSHHISAGSLEFRAVQMRYREGLPLVLRDVSFTIAPREKVGIVGRTGSGKSTLLLTFMRMVDICGGEIVVNGAPIRSFGLRALRRQFSMIPQDPVLFDGTVRLNVDPFLEASSAEVWEALELVGLRERISSESEGIDSRVLEGGSNFSVGQRQLLCMARALLKRGSGFILMDEATANIDQSLDRHIQNTVMKAFAAYTVITIAHRLHTVAQYDKIIVMDHGVVAEMGSPRELVQQRQSVFRGMVESLGDAGMAEFMELVESSV